jgi:ketosteroid isomerase-like protein
MVGDGPGGGGSGAAVPFRTANVSASEPSQPRRIQNCARRHYSVPDPGVPSPSPTLLVPVSSSGLDRTSVTARAVATDDCLPVVSSCLAKDDAEKPNMSEQTTSQRRQMVLDLFRMIDSKNIDGLLAYMAPEATQRFAHQEPLRGHAEIRAGNAAFFNAIESATHEITGLWEWDGTVVVRINVTYVRLDGLTVTIPAVTIFRESDGLIVEYEVFVDTAPIFAPA